MKLPAIEDNRYLQAVVFILALLTLLYGADALALFEIEALLGVGALKTVESGELWAATEISPLIQMIQAGSLSAIGMNEWGVRMPSILLLVVGFSAFHILGKKIFTAKATLFTLMLAIGSYSLVLIGKLGVSDVWMFTSSLLIYLLVIYQLKKPTILRSIALVALSILLMLIQPISAIFFIVVLFQLMYFLHPNKKNIKWEFIIIIAAYVVYFLVFGEQKILGGYLFSYQKNISYYVLATFGGMLFSMGFLPAALVHLIKRVRADEELSKLLLVGIIAGLASMSLLAHFLFIFLIAKQILTYTQKNYPYRNTAKVGVIFQVVIGFFIALYFTMNGYYWFGGSGFRTAFLYGVPFWGFGIYTLVSMYSVSRKHIILSVILAGVLSNFLFWTQVTPFWEAERNLYKDVSSYIETTTKDSTYQIVLPESWNNSKTVNFYTQTQLQKHTVSFGSRTTNNAVLPTLSVVEKDSVDGTKASRILKGRDFPWENMRVIYID